MRTFSRRLLLLLASSVYVTTGYALSYQAIIGLGYSNPAALTTITNTEVILGGLGIAPAFEFKGNVSQPNHTFPYGTTSSNVHSFSPYGRLAYRFTPCLVGSIDVTQPLFSSFKYPLGSILQYDTTSTYLRSTDISPRISYQATQELALGLGLDINNLYNAQLNFSVPPFGDLTNKASSWAYGFNAGLFYTARKGTYISLYYYSKIVQHARGVSKWGPFVTRPARASVIIPAVSTLNLIQFLSPTWMVSSLVRYIEWNPVRNTTLQNIALPTHNLVIPEHYYNSWDFALATQYGFNDKWAGIVSIEYNPQSQATPNRIVALPVFSGTIPAVGAEYHLTKALKAKLIYAHVFGHPRINYHQNPLGPIVGHFNVNVNAFDFSMTYDV